MAVMMAEMSTEKNDLLNSVFDISDNGLVIFDPQGDIELWNNWMQKYTGLSAEEVLGRKLGDVFPELINSRVEQAITQAIRQGAASIISQSIHKAPIPLYASDNDRRENNRIDHSIIVKPIRINSKMRHCFLQINDVSASVKREQLLRKQKLDLQESIKLQKKNESKLKQYSSELVRSNEELEKFAYVASHDLQEPLRMVSSYTGLLANRYEDKLDDQAREFIEFAKDGTQRMQRLIKDLLEYSRVSTQGNTLIPVDCNSIYDDVINMLKLSIDECDATIRKSTLPVVSGDVSQLRQLFQNLIANAIKYREKDKLVEVDILVKQDGDHWQFSIADNGIGIDPQFYSRIFDVFQRLHTRDQYSGTGIGLAICKKIVARHGGRIWIESTSGKGSTFYFTLANAATEINAEDDGVVLMKEAVN